MDEKLDKLIRLLIDNGISLNRAGDWFCCTELELDLSEHDKPFKVKIRELEESYQKNAREIWALEKEMDIILNTLDLELQNNKVAVLKENKKVVGLDFSEHDKVFEDKISELKEKIAIKDMDYKTASELLGKYQRENGVLKRRIQELDAIDTMRIDENRELKQRIAELENRKTENFDEAPDSITIDGYKCKIINTERGLYISRDEIYSIIDKEKEPLKQQCKELEDRHQSDCIEINRLNTAIDVLIHKVEYLRQFAGLE